MVEASVERELVEMSEEVEDVDWVRLSLPSCSFRLSASHCSVSALNLRSVFFSSFAEFHCHFLFVSRDVVEGRGFSDDTRLRVIHDILRL